MLIPSLSLRDEEAPMTARTGRRGHGSTAYRDAAGQPTAEVRVRRVHPLRRTTPASIRLGEADPQPVGLGEILTVGADPDGVPDGPPGRSGAPGTGRRADLVAGPLLLLAGLAAGASLLVVWVHGGVAGLDLVGAGLRDVREGAGTPAATGSWQPLVVVGGGTVLFVLGVLMYVPARTHRFLGVLALLASLAVATAVLFPLSEAGWDTARWAVGAWCAAATGGLGLLGALKALSTGPRPGG
jgi:hypothetical protein